MQFGTRPRAILLLDIETHGDALCMTQHCGHAIFDAPIAVPAPGAESDAWCSKDIEPPSMGGCALPIPATAREA